MEKKKSQRTGLAKLPPVYHTYLIVLSYSSTSVHSSVDLAKNTQVSFIRSSSLYEGSFITWNLNQVMCFSPINLSSSVFRHSQGSKEGQGKLFPPLRLPKRRSRKPIKWNRSFRAQHWRGRAEGVNSQIDLKSQKAQWFRKTANSKKQNADDHVNNSQMWFTVGKL